MSSFSFGWTNNLPWEREKINLKKLCKRRYNFIISFILQILQLFYTKFKICFRRLVLLEIIFFEKIYITVVQKLAIRCKWIFVLELRFHLLTFFDKYGPMWSCKYICLGCWCTHYSIEFCCSFLLGTSGSYLCLCRSVFVGGSIVIGLKNLAPFCCPIRSKTESNRHSLSYTLREFWLVNWGGSALFDWQSDFCGFGFTTLCYKHCLFFFQDHGSISDLTASTHEVVSSNKSELEVVKNFCEVAVLPFFVLSLPLFVYFKVINHFISGLKESSEFCFPGAKQSLNGMKGIFRVEGKQNSLFSLRASNLPYLPTQK